MPDNPTNDLGYSTENRIRLVSATVKHMAKKGALEALVHLRIPAEGPMPDHSCVAQECDECLHRLFRKAEKKLGRQLPPDAEVTIIRDRQTYSTPRKPEAPIVNPIYVKR